jgi:hypothetical protein
MSYLLFWFDHHGLVLDIRRVDTDAGEGSQGYF